MTTHLDNWARYTLDGASVLTIVGTLLGWLPNIAAALSIIWLGLQIYSWVELRLIKKNK